MKCLTRSRAPEDKAEELKGLKQSAPSSCLPSSISSPHLENDPKGPHNKENYKEKPGSVDVLLSDDEVLLSSSSLAEDSGYLSLHNSQLEHFDGDTHCTDTPEKCTDEKECRLSPGHSDSKATCLPVLKFQQEVCRQLAKTYKKSQSYDWTVINKLAKCYGIHNVIGSKMGRDYVDILSGLLKKDMKHILTRILGLLGDCDLISCTKVSKTWRKILHQDTKVVQRCRAAEQMLRDSGRSTGSLSRDFGLSRVVFSCLQSVASSTPGHKATKKSNSQTDESRTSTKPSRFTEFHEATKSLKRHEALRSCRLCGSPARYDAAMKRAVCLRASCAFDFCSLCQSAFHGSTQCQRGIIKASPHCQSVPLAGSTRSKRSIRRL
ncbi:F-box only protein 5 [Tachysurus vachellii]|uniref:F-box only protein 5 n=1 Tax=Tachysurus vachellii TaxID=175792 RepID=UPI00296B10BD|nr:F-box only protein 5 [Tachysurus vachellii]